MGGGEVCLYTSLFKYNYYNQSPWMTTNPTSRDSSIYIPLKDSGNIPNMTQLEKLSTAAKAMPLLGQKANHSQLL